MYFPRILSAYYVCFQFHVLLHANAQPVRKFSKVITIFILHIKSSSKLTFRVFLDSLGTTGAVAFKFNRVEILKCRHHSLFL